MLPNIGQSALELSDKWVWPLCFSSWFMLTHADADLMRVERVFYCILHRCSAIMLAESLIVLYICGDLVNGLNDILGIFSWILHQVNLYSSAQKRNLSNDVLEVHLYPAKAPAHFDRQNMIFKNTELQLDFGNWLWSLKFNSRSFFSSSSVGQQYVSHLPMWNSRTLKTEIMWQMIRVKLNIKYSLIS